MTVTLKGTTGGCVRFCQTLITIMFNVLQLRGYALELGYRVTESYRVRGPLGVGVRLGPLDRISCQGE